MFDWDIGFVGVLIVFVVVSFCGWAFWEAVFWLFRHVQFGWA